MLCELCQAFRRVGAALSHKLQLPEHRGMQDGAVLESLVSFGAAEVTTKHLVRSSGNIFLLTASLASDCLPTLGGEGRKSKVLAEGPLFSKSIFFFF